MSFLRPLITAVVLVVGLLATSAVAQDFQPMDDGGGQSSGNPLYGYLSTAFLGAVAIFVLCKSARR